MIMISRAALKKIIDFSIALLTVLAGFLGGAATAKAAEVLSMI